MRKRSRGQAQVSDAIADDQPTRDPSRDSGGEGAGKKHEGHVVAISSLFVLGAKWAHPASSYGS